MLNLKEAYGYFNFISQCGRSIISFPVFHLLSKGENNFLSSSQNGVKLSACIREGLGVFFSWKGCMKDIKGP